jgi:dynein heavy chain
MDFLSMEALSNIYTLSVRDLITKLQSMVEIDESYILKDASARAAVRFDEPLFQIKLESNFIEIHPSYFEEEEIPEFIPPPFGNSKLEDFSLLYHVHLMEDVVKTDVVDPTAKKGKKDEEEEEEEDHEDGGGFDENRVYKGVRIPNICKIWINVRPGLDQFYSDLVRCIGEGLNSIQAFERWSRHDDMTQYFSVLEEWDDMAGDEWENPDSNYLNPQDWLDSSPSETFSGIVR